MRSRIAYTILWTLPTVILSSISFVLTSMEIRERETKAKEARVDKCAREYANKVVFEMFRDGTPRGVNSLEEEWKFAYMSHLLTDHQ